MTDCMLLIDAWMGPEVLVCQTVALAAALVYAGVHPCIHRAHFVQTFYFKWRTFAVRDTLNVAADIVSRTTVALSPWTGAAVFVLYRFRLAVSTAYPYLFVYLGNCSTVWYLKYRTNAVIESLKPDGNAIEAGRVNAAGRGCYLRCMENMKDEFGSLKREIITLFGAAPFVSASFCRSEHSIFRTWPQVSDAVPAFLFYLLLRCRA